MSKRTPLSPRQQAAFDVLQRMINEGKQPTFDEIGQELGLVKDSARNLLIKCKKKGYIDWDKHQRQTIRIIEYVEKRCWT